MKKSNYLAYLNEYQNLQQDHINQAIFKSIKPLIKNTTKTFKSKSNLQLQSLKNKQSHKNKQNIHPNINQNHPNIQSQYNNKNKNKQNNESKQHFPPEFNVNLTKCNFQLSHSSENLYLIQRGSDQELIVCEKCAQKFINKVRINQIFNKNISKSISYSSLIQKYKNYQEQNKKLLTIKECLLMKTKMEIRKIDQYYQRFIGKIMQSRDNVENRILSINKVNQIKIQSLIKENNKNLSVLSEMIKTLESQCRQIKVTSQQWDKLGRQIERMEGKRQKQKYIQLDCFSVQIQLSQTLLNQFYEQFISSNFNIKLISISNQVDKRSFELQQIQQCHLYGDESDSLLNGNDDVIMQRIKQPQLNKEFLEEELLLQSYRDENSEKLARDREQMSKKINENFKTGTSTHRVNTQSNIIKTTKNFLKQIHLQKNQIEDDLFCDEQLNLSTSHPIHMNSLRKFPFERKKAQSYQPKQQPKKSLNEMDINYFNQQLKNQRNQKQDKFDITSLVSHASIITVKNTNKNQISFEMDENIIFDGNILDSEENQNYDIISPAFKII